MRTQTTEFAPPFLIVDVARVTTPMPISNVLLVSGSARFSTRDVWEGYCAALISLGLNVVPYPLFSMLDLLSPELTLTDVLGKAIDSANRIDCVIFTDGLYFRGRRARIPQSIRRAGIPTVLIATDDPYETIPQAEALYTHIFTNELSSAEDSSDYLATATQLPPDIQHLDEPSFKLSFVGTVFEDRVELLLELARFCEKQQYRFLIAGKFPEGTEQFRDFTFTDVRPGTILDEDKWQIYSDSEVVLNVFRTTEAPAHSPNPRVFEVTGFGHAALLTGSPRSEVTRLFGESIYEFDDADSACQQLQMAIENPDDRRQRVQRCQKITLEGHLYSNRAETMIRILHERAVEQADFANLEEQTAWITGCGRTGSTWLSEMLADIPGVRRWHEPYFGRFFKHVHERPGEKNRQSSFFAARFQDIWVQGVRKMFYEMVAQRYPQMGRHSLIIKEVNTPELFGMIRHVFRSSGMILLIRDPFDILDSYLDLQKPGSWNSNFGETTKASLASSAERSASHIAEALSVAVTAYDDYPDRRKLLLRYEELLVDPIPALIACGQLVGQDVSEDQARAAADKHRFENYKQTGTLEFRRHGKAGSWQESGNFTNAVTEIAERILGQLRARLGYQSAPKG